MILCVVLILALHGELNGSPAQAAGMEKIQECETKCSKGLKCNTKPYYPFAPCRKQQPEELDSLVFNNVSLSTVMRCEGRQRCSLHLRVSTALLLSEHIHGVSICMVAAGMLGGCKLINFPRKATGRLAGQQVEVQSDCFDAGLGQDLHVTLKTVPNYCAVTWTSTYRTPDCSSGDLRSNIPDCITGRLAYTVDQNRKELTVRVSEMLEDKDYNLRLCHRGYTCRGTGASALIQKEELRRNVTLQYSRPLPCLCIEGWSAVLDAPRVQVCPFKDRLEELWSGVNFDPVEETLSWEPVCPLAVVISLCQQGQGGACVNLANASQTLGRDKVTFSKVDPHPELCMKFTTDSGSWIRCPFADRYFQAWEMGVAERAGEQQVVMTSRIRATLSVGVCMKTGTSPCHPDGTYTVHVDKYEPVSLNLTVDLCKPNICLQVKRLDVKYSSTILHCHLRCSRQAKTLADDDAHAPDVNDHAIAKQTSGGQWEVICVLVPAGACLVALAVVALVANIMLTVHQRNNRKAQDSGCASKKHTEPHHALAVTRVTPQCQPQTVVHNGTPTRGSPQFQNCEKANLLTGYTV